MFITAASTEISKAGIGHRLLVADRRHRCGAIVRDALQSNTMSNEPKVYPDSQNDRLTIIVRGVCGAILGLVVAAGIWVRCGGIGPWGSVALFAGAVIGRALGSIRHGDSFWYSLLRR